MASARSRALLDPLSELSLWPLAPAPRQVRRKRTGRSSEPPCRGTWPCVPRTAGAGTSAGSIARRPGALVRRSWHGRNHGKGFPFVRGAADCGNPHLPAIDPWMSDHVCVSTEGARPGRHESVLPYLGVCIRARVARTGLPFCSVRWIAFRNAKQHLCVFLYSNTRTFLCL